MDDAIRVTGFGREAGGVQSAECDIGLRLFCEVDVDSGREGLCDA